MTWKWCSTDEWFSSDKLLHGLAGLMITVLTGPVGGAFLGVGKEVIDAVDEKGSGFSYKDLCATLAGTLAGSGIFFWWA